MAIEYFCIKERDFDLVEQLIEIETATYDSSALDVFDLISMLRHARVYVAVENDVVLGVVYFMRDFDDIDKAFLHSINIVDPKEYPDLGTSLLKVAFNDLKKSDIRVIEVNVDSSNIRALKIYREKLGFVPHDSIQSEIFTNEEILILQKELS